MKTNETEVFATLRLKARTWREDDLPSLLVIRNDVDLQAQLLSTARGNDPDAVRSWLDRKNTGGDMLLVVEHGESGEVAGYLQISVEEGVGDCYRFGVCLIRNYHSMGFGQELLAGMAEFLRKCKNASKIILNVDAENKRAISCYTKLGYRRICTLERHVHVNESWRDVDVMEKLLPG